jgi:murein DD-endopeptidase MepM/ murein hydrolase activator NlpD
MITDILRGGGLKSADKTVVARLAACATGFVKERRRVVSLAGAGFAAVVAVAAGAAGYLHYAGLASNERQAAMHAETANAALQDELTKLRDQLGATKGRLAAVSSEQQRLEAEHKQQPAPDATPAVKADKAQLSHALDQAQKELHLTEAQRVTLLARLSKAETEAHTTSVSSQKQLQQIEADRDRIAAERDALKAKIAKLEQKNSARQGQQPPVAATTAEPTPMPAQAAAAAVPRPTRKAEAVVVAPHGRSPVGEVEKVLASAGVDVARLFSQFGVSRGEGGPFVPLSKGSVAPPSTLTPEKLAALRTMMKALPVTAPLADYRLGSPFGAREDPINGRSSFHTGLDLDAPYDSKVYATAPGVVTYAGYRDDYGKIVEIDHGHGLTTRYAHLHQYTVSVGERVAAHQQIGYLGSTGRVTGPHVHYEVLVNGEPQDPAKFLQLGHIVPVAQTR